MDEDSTWCQAFARTDNPTCGHRMCPGCNLRLANVDICICHAYDAVPDFAQNLAALRKGEESASVLTDYVATRWYRAPEILLGSTWSA